MVIADKADTLMYVKFDPTNNVRYEFHNSFGGNYLQIWKIHDVEIDSNIRTTTEILQNDIGLPDTLVHNATHDEIIWMLANPGKDTLLTWIEYNQVLEGKPFWFPLYDLGVFTTGIQLIAQRDSSRFIVEPREFREWTWNTSDKMWGGAYYGFLGVSLLMSILIFKETINKGSYIYHGSIYIAFSIFIWKTLDVNVIIPTLLVVVSFLLSTFWKRKKADLVS